jgi:hypothetical protein
MGTINEWNVTSLRGNGRGKEKTPATTARKPGSLQQGIEAEQGLARTSTRSPQNNWNLSKGQEELDIFLAYEGIRRTG